MLFRSLDSATLAVASAPFKITSIITQPPGANGSLDPNTAATQPYDYAVVMFNNEYTRAVN